MKLEIELPFVIDKLDYHELSDLYHDFLDITKDSKLKYTEFRFCFDGKYWAIFYKGRRPSKKKIVELVNRRPDCGDCSIEELEMS